MSLSEHIRVNRLIQDGSIRAYDSNAISRWSEMALSAGYKVLSEELAEIAKSVA